MTPQDLLQEKDNEPTIYCPPYQTVGENSSESEPGGMNFKVHDRKNNHAQCPHLHAELEITYIIAHYYVMYMSFCNCMHDIIYMHRT